MTTAIRGNSLYTIVDGPTWESAEGNAVTAGGHLVTIGNAAENASLIANGLVGTPKWIGITDKDSEGTWTWISGESSTYTNWSPGQPDNSTASNTTGGQDYGVIGTTGQWDDGENPFWAGIAALSGIAEIALTLSVTRSGTPTEGAGVFTSSINLSAGTTTNLANGTTVYWTVSGITSDDLASGSLTGSGTISSGKLDIQHSLVSDADSGENFQVTVYSDSARTLQIGTTASVAIQEAPAPVSSGGGGGSSSTSTPASATTTTTTTTTTTPGASTPAQTSTSTSPTTTTSSTTTNTSGQTSESSALGITLQATVRTVPLSTPTSFGSLQVSQAVVGTIQSDIITGSDASEALSGGLGKDQITGGKGADAFIFERAGEFGKQKYDTITDFNPTDGDKVVISTEAFTGVTQVVLKTVSGKKAAKAASKGNSNFVYDRASGFLYFDSNGKKNGWGDGGEFAKLLGSPEISKSDFVIV